MSMTRSEKGGGLVVVLLVSVVVSAFFDRKDAERLQETATRIEQARRETMAAEIETLVTLGNITLQEQREMAILMKSQAQATIRLLELTRIDVATTK